MTPLLKKELRQAWRSFRLPALLILFGFFAIADPLVTRYMGEILQRFAGGVQIIVPPPSATGAMGQFMGDLTEIGFLAIIGITMGIVAGEKNSGVTTFVVTKPVSRSTYVLAKLVVMSLGLLAAVSATAVVAALYTWTLMGPVSPESVALAALSSFLYLEFVMVVTMALSMVAPSPLTAGGLSLMFLLALSLLRAFLHHTAVGSYFPSALPGISLNFLAAPSDPTHLGNFFRAASTCILGGTAVFGGGLAAFRRKELP